MKKWMAMLMVLVFASISHGQGIIDTWDFSVADGSSMSTALSTSDIGTGGSKFGNSDNVKVFSQTMFFNKVNVAKSYFKAATISASGWSGASGTGLLEMEFDVPSVDWSLTAAADTNASIVVGIEDNVVNPSEGDLFVHVDYQGGSNVTNMTGSGTTNVYADADHIALMLQLPFEADWKEMVVFPGSGAGLANLHIRVRCNLLSGTVEFYYTEGVNPEVLAYSGSLDPSFTVSQWYVYSIMKDGASSGYYWVPGDTASIDNLTYTEILPPTPPPALTVIDSWGYEGLTNDAAISEAVSTGYVGGVAFLDSPLVSITNLVDGATTNGALRLTVDPLGVADSMFLTASPSVYAGSSTGVYEVVMDIPSMDFAETSLAGFDANFGFEVRDSLGNAMGIVIDYDTGNDEIQLAFKDATGESILKTIPGPLANDIKMRFRMGLGQTGLSGSAQVFYTVGGVEVGKYDGMVYSGFNLAQYRLRAATTLSGKGWQAGDVTVIDNLKIEKVASLESAPVYVDIVNYQMNDSGGTLLEALSQTGSDTGHFTGTDSFISTDGAGSLVFNPVSASVTRKHILVTTFTKGLNRLEFALDDWNLDATSDDSAVAFSLVDDTGTNQVVFAMDVNTNNATVRFRAAANNGGGSGQDTSYGGYVAGTGVVLRLEVNLDANSFSASWRYDNGGEFVGLVSGASLGQLDNVSEVRLSVDDTGWDAADFVNVDYLVFSSSSDEAPWNPTSRYTAWVDAYPLGASTNMTDNPDGDLLDNLAEYALGGDPSNGADIGHVPTSALTEAGGTNYLEYVYAKLKDNVSANRGLSYVLETTDNLVFGTWASSPAMEWVGTGSLDDDFNLSTNRISTDVLDEQFIRLQIELTP